MSEVGQAGTERRQTAAIRGDRNRHGISLHGLGEYLQDLRLQGVIEREIRIDWIPKMQARCQHPGVLPGAVVVQRGQWDKSERDAGQLRLVVWQACATLQQRWIGTDFLEHRRD